MVMQLTQKLTLCAATRTAASAPAIPFFWTPPPPTLSGAPTATRFAAGSTSIAIPQSASQSNGNGDKDKTQTSIPTTGLKPSYVILDEAIPLVDAYRILGRLVANVKCPLQEYTPSQVIPGTKVPNLDETFTMLASNGDVLTRQSTSASAASITSNSSSRSSVASSDRTLVDDDDDGITEGEAKFVRELEKYKTTLIFSNLPLTISSSTTATVTHRSQYSTKTNSFLTAMLGISISSSKSSTTTYRLDSALIRTLSLTQHNLVWAALLHGQYKKEVMTAVRRNGGKMFLVIGLKVARDAEMQKEVSRGKALSGGVRVDLGGGVGVQGLGKVAVGKDGEGASIGVGGGQTREVVDEGSRKERLLGDRAFAVEYREVRLKLKLEMGKSRGREDKREREKKERNMMSREQYIAELQKRLQELCEYQQEAMMATQLLQAFSLPHPPTHPEVHSFKPHFSIPESDDEIGRGRPRTVEATMHSGSREESQFEKHKRFGLFDIHGDAEEYGSGQMCAVDEMYGTYFHDEGDHANANTVDYDDDYDKYELELGEDLYVQETDTLW
ncbi:hypothetical protein L211DRAFT_853850 [Terfezia boudieri ATCC MYA-4762]|uniref:Uncharacterized protein n=1 Tax=Terfezia boudieri ATCC MYA-4762 TaxID=1051890 RepID=A0A3N4LB92_9PEZI|nr:hypothetical protein L211DRAFT_853850 [Terfezia boudieri ATCC MYA-4762]